MGALTRLRNGIVNFLSESPRQINGTHSVNLNQMKQSLSNPTLYSTVGENTSLLSEAVPGFSQPVWGPDINTVGAYSREGYTSKTFDSPAVRFSTQANALQIDEDVQLAINDLASKVTGGEHYIKGDNEQFVKYMERFTKNLQFDTFDTDLIKELLWYGNSVWKPRMGIRNVEKFEDLMHIPISSFVHIWWDRQRIPYKYEFRGAEYQGYHNPGEILHFKWNPVNASVFGTGFGVAVCSTREFTMPLANEQSVDVQLPSMLDRKYSTQFTMQMAEQRYISRNVWIADGASATERATLQSSVESAQIGQDIVAGTGVEIKELGSAARNFNPEQFADITQGAIFKALNDFRGKQAGESNHTYANAERAALLDELGLTAFPIAIRDQLSELLFKPWYESHPFYDPMYYGGALAVPWEETGFDLNFGQVDKKDISVEDMIKLIELYMNTPIPKDPESVMKLFEKAGLPVDAKSIAQIGSQYNGMPQTPDSTQQPAFPPNSDIGGGQIPNFDRANMGSPPQDSPIFNDMMIDIRGSPFVDSGYRRSNQSQDYETGRSYE